MSVFQDISDRKRTELELITAIEAAMQDYVLAQPRDHGQARRLFAPRAPAGKGFRTPASADLTTRERERCLALIAEGRHRRQNRSGPFS